MLTNPVVYAGDDAASTMNFTCRSAAASSGIVMATSKRLGRAPPCFKFDRNSTAENAML
jgi:hypothetical protein